MEEILDNGIVIFSFYLFGIGGPLAWNTILADLDFFIKYQGEYSPEFILPNMNFILSFVFQYIIIVYGKRFSYKLLIITSFIIKSISLLLIPLAIVLFRGLLGFIITSIIIIFQGLTNAIAMSCFNGLIAYFPDEYRVGYSTGSGIAGILMNLIKYLILLIFADGNEDSRVIISSIIFFCFAVIIILICIVFILVLYKNPYFIHKMINSGEFKNKYQILDEDNQIINKTKHKHSDKNKTMKDTIHLIPDKCFLIFLNYVITFSIFPGVVIMPNLFNLPSGWKINTFIFIFNLFDTIGRFIPNYFMVKNKGLIISIFLRFIIVLLYPMIIALERTYLVGSGLISVSAVILLSIFALSNGYITTTAFVIGINNLEDDLKCSAGPLLCFFMTVGIFSGTIFATLVMQRFANY